MSWFDKFINKESHTEQCKVNLRTQFTSHSSRLAIFDPKVLAHHRNNEQPWWDQSDQDQIEELKNGQFALTNLGAEGQYSIRVAYKGRLSPQEKAFVNCELPPVGLEVKSGNLVIGDAALLPGNHQMPDPRDPDLIPQIYHSPIQKSAFVINVPDGYYQLSVYGLDFDCIADNHEKLADDIRRDLTDIVVFLKPIKRAINVKQTALILDFINMHYLYPSTLRETLANPEKVPA